jgi:hypothetical protein
VASKAQQSETVQQNTHKFLKQQRAIKFFTTQNNQRNHNFNKPILSFAKRITTQSFQRKDPRIYTVANLRKTQTNTLPRHRSFHTQSEIHGWEKRTIHVTNGFKKGELVEQFPPGLNLRA